MCVVSMVMDHYWDKWREYPYGPTSPNTDPCIRPAIYPQRQITPEEVEEFRRLLERAREYDRKNNEPDCELDSKRKRIKDLADQLGVKIDFL